MNMVAKAVFAAALAVLSLSAGATSLGLNQSTTLEGNITDLSTPDTFSLTSEIDGQFLIERTDDNKGRLYTLNFIDGEFSEMVTGISSGDTYAFDVTAGTEYQIDVNFQGGNQQSLFNPYQFTVTAVPIPAAAWLFGSALLGIAVVSRRSRAAAAPLVA